LFLIDGFALIYRAFFAMISRPLTTSRGENTSAAWGVVNFLQRLLTTHKPEYVAWIHDSGLSFRHERYPSYKATREKLTNELQADFDRGIERITQLLDAFRVQILSVDGYEADDVIGTLAREAAANGLNVVIVSGDKDFQQLIRPNVWLLNPGRGGPASVDEQWVGLENASERLGVPPERVVDYLALLGDTSDNIPGVPGVGEKTARDLLEQFGTLEAVLSRAAEVTKKRPREALLEHADRARLSKELVTIRDDLPIALELDRLRVQSPDSDRLRQLYVELEFNTLAKDIAANVEEKTEQATQYTVIDAIPAVDALIGKIRAAGHIAFDTITVRDLESPAPLDPLRSRVVAMSIAIAPGEAYYLPFGHRSWSRPQGDLLDSIAEPDPRRSAALDATAAESANEPNDSGLDVEQKPTRPPKTKRAAAAGEPSSIAARLLVGSVPPVKNLPPLTSDEMRPLRAVLEDASIRKTAQNAKYDLLTLRRIGIDVHGLDFDTMVASYVLDPGRRSHGLDVLALEFFDYRLTSYEELCGKGRSEIPFDACPIEGAAAYSCEEADFTLRLRVLFEPQLAAYDLMRLFQEIEIPLSGVLAEMEWTGISIDLAWFASLKERFQRERERVELEIYREAGERFNINSNLQLRAILFEKLELPIRKRTATGPSTDASVLQELADNGHVLPELLLEYRELWKLEGTYIDTLPALIHPSDQRLHTSFNQTVAATGRLSSSDPNLQNIPIRRELGRDIRRGFVPRAGCQLIAADYSQIELRLLAHLSQDEAFVEAFESGGDIHKQTASIIFGVPLPEVTADMRGRAKTINFATIYGQGPNALSQKLRITLAEAKAFIATYFERFHGIRNYLDSMVAFAKENGYVETIFKRRRYIPELRDRNFNIRSFGERVATNAPIQGSAADLIKIAMIRIDHALREQRLESKMLLQVHDELVFEAPLSEVDTLCGLVTSQMEHAAELSVPLVVDLGTGANWLDTKLK
jgi:DNA polymerase-1